jgi:peptidoglycan/LPS O-acetylase OafA/YrhL
VPKPIRAETRRDIQYLRAVAVISVVAFHFWPNRLVNGFLGVDVFFVISGYLITSHIVREIGSTRRFSLTAFWVRRIRRIFPAAIVVIAATIYAVFQTHIADMASNIGRHALAAAFSAENILLGLDSADYVHRTDATSPLQHYWSLAVEEQFYIVWPILVLIALGIALITKSRFTRFLGIALIGIIAASLWYAITVSQGNPSSYFDPFARAWELAFGAGVAVWGTLDPTFRRTRLVANRLGWFVLLAMFAVPDLTDFAPGIGIVPSVIAAAVILGTGPGQVHRHLPLSRPVLALFEYVGDRSYSIYLWHWPILLLAPIFLDRHLVMTDKLAGIALTIVLSEISYRLVENPIRRLSGRWSRNPFVVLPIALVTSSAVVFGGLTFVPKIPVQHQLAAEITNGMSSTVLPSTTPNFNPNYPYTDPYCDAAGAAVFSCPTVTDITADPLTYAISPPRTPTCQYASDTLIDDCVTGDVTATRSIALVGDSHARAMWAGFDVIGKRGGYAVHNFLMPGCSYRLYKIAECVDHNRAIEPTLNSGKFDLVVLVQKSFPRTASESRADNPYFKLFNEFVRNGIPVVVFKDNPQLNQKMFRCLQMNPRPGRCSFPLRPAIDDAMQTAQTLGIPVINLDPVYCPNNRCTLVEGGMQVWRDNGHILSYFHQTAAPLVWSELMKLGLIAPLK